MKKNSGRITLTSEEKSTLKQQRNIAKVTPLGMTHPAVNRDELTVLVWKKNKAVRVDLLGEGLGEENLAENPTFLKLKQELLDCVCIYYRKWTTGQISGLHPNLYPSFSPIETFKLFVRALIFLDQNSIYGPINTIKDFSITKEMQLAWVEHRISEGFGSTTASTAFKWLRAAGWTKRYQLTGLGGKTSKEMVSSPLPKVFGGANSSSEQLSKIRTDLKNEVVDILKRWDWLAGLEQGIDSNPELSDKQGFYLHKKKGGAKSEIDYIEEASEGATSNASFLYRDPTIPKDLTINWWTGPRQTKGDVALTTMRIETANPLVHYETKIVGSKQKRRVFLLPVKGGGTRDFEVSELGRIKKREMDKIVAYLIAISGWNHSTWTNFTLEDLNKFEENSFDSNFLNYDGEKFRASGEQPFTDRTYRQRASKSELIPMCALDILLKVKKHTTRFRWMLDDAHKEFLFIYQKKSTLEQFSRPEVCDGTDHRSTVACGLTRREIRDLVLRALVEKNLSLEELEFHLGHAEGNPIPSYYQKTDTQRIFNQRIVDLQSTIVRLAREGRDCGPIATAFEIRGGNTKFKAVCDSNFVPPSGIYEDGPHCLRQRCYLCPNATITEESFEPLIEKAAEIYWFIKGGASMNQVKKYGLISHLDRIEKNIGYHFKHRLDECNSLFNRFLSQIESQEKQPNLRDY